MATNGGPEAAGRRAGRGDGTAIFTVGHSNHPIERFLDLLAGHRIAVLVDVRSRPYSRWVPHFAKERLARSISATGSRYVFLGRELGGRPSGDEFYDARGRVDYGRRAQAAEFVTGIATLVEIAGARLTAVLCAEEDPLRCHRRRLIAPALHRRGLRVVHIRGDGRLEEDDTLQWQGAVQLPLFPKA